MYIYIHIYVDERLESTIYIYTHIAVQNKASSAHDGRGTSRRNRRRTQESAKLGSGYSTDRPRQLAPGAAWHNNLRQSVCVYIYICLFRYLLTI